MRENESLMRITQFYNIYAFFKYIIFFERDNNTTVIILKSFTK